jgi:hypothetical protein
MEKPIPSLEQAFDLLPILCPLAARSYGQNLTTENPEKLSIGHSPANPLSYCVSVRKLVPGPHMTCTAFLNPFTIEIT